MAAVFSATEVQVRGEAPRIEGSCLSSAVLTGYPAGTVFLNVYDLNEFNSCLSPLGVGLYHAGVEVFGKEYRFGGSDAGTGVGFNAPRVCVPHTFREQFTLGVTSMTNDDVEEIIDEFKDDASWGGTTYHIVSHNCLHFAQAFGQKLLARSRDAADPGTDKAAQVVVPVWHGGSTKTSESASGADAQSAQLIPPHVDRLSRLADTWVPAKLTDWLDGWDKAGSRSGV